MVAAEPVLSLLARADATPGRPVLGGMARPDGVVIASERYWAFAGRDGTVLEGEMHRPPSVLRRVPLVRGLARLAAAVSPLLRGGGVAGGRERLLLLGALLAPCIFILLPDRVALAAGLAVTGALLAWLFRGRTLFLHGAEHRAIAAAESASLVACWAGAARPSRFSPRCGTNFVALALPVAYAAEFVWPLEHAVYTPVVVAALALGLTMELWRAVQDSTRRGARLLLVPGLVLQRVTTREPSLAETRVALTAVASVLRRELA